MTTRRPLGTGPTAPADSAGHGERLLPAERTDREAVLLEDREHHDQDHGEATRRRLGTGAARSLAAASGSAETV